MEVIPMQRPVQAQEIAEAAVFLASDLAQSITGHTIVIDGGLSLSASRPVGDGAADRSGNPQRIMIGSRGYTSGRIAVANLSTLIDSLGLHRVERATFENLVAWSKFLFVRRDLLSRIADHDRAERVATEAVALSPGTGSALYTRAGGAVAERRGPTKPPGPRRSGTTAKRTSLHR
jgi:enoyl-ACP reductase-like protein